MPAFLRRFWPVIATVLLVIGIGIGVFATNSNAAVTQPVYICQQFDGCANNQFLEVFDHNGAPIFSVGATGGPKTFGDNMGVYSPSSVFNPSVVTSYTDPATYNKTFGLANKCVPPQLWIAPTAFYTCSSSGTWVRHAI